MYNKKHFIMALIIIFICGFISGAALAPVVIHKITGNPYSKAHISERVFNVKYLKNIGLSDKQKEEVKEILEKYLEMYKSARTSFSNSRNFIYSEFNSALKNVLTENQYESYRLHSENEFAKRREYRNKMEFELKNTEK